MLTSKLFTMIMRRLVALLCASCFILPACSDEWLHRQSVQADFELVKDALVTAIENRGLVVNYTSHIGEMLARTGADIGKTERLFEKAETIEFCSARLSRQMMAANPHHIVLCPFSVSIYVLPTSPSTVWLSYRQPQGQSAETIRQLLQGVVNEATR